MNDNNINDTHIVLLIHTGKTGYSAVSFHHFMLLFKCYKFV